MNPRPNARNTNQAIMAGATGGLFSAAIAAFISSARTNPFRMNSLTLMIRPATSPPMTTRPRLIRPMHHLHATVLPNSPTGCCVHGHQYRRAALRACGEHHAVRFDAHQLGRLQIRDNDNSAAHERIRLVRFRDSCEDRPLLGTEIHEKLDQLLRFRYGLGCEYFRRAQLDLHELVDRDSAIGWRRRRFWFLGAGFRGLRCGVLISHLAKFLNRFVNSREKRLDGAQTCSWFQA